MSIIINNDYLLRIEELMKSYPSKSVEKILRNFFIRSGLNETDTFFCKISNPYFILIPENKKYNILIDRYDISIFCTRTSDKLLIDLNHIIRACGYLPSMNKSNRTEINLFIEPGLF